ncbi:MAG: hypothetical protein GY929_11580 [Actinomycetia bacterium]|nr:hypothetical protein [Actinomycetes bacterium]
MARNWPEANNVQLFVSDGWHRRMPTGPGDEATRRLLGLHQPFFYDG